MIASQIAFAAALLTGATAPSIPLSAGEIRLRVGEAQRRLWAWDVVYETAREAGPGVPAESYLRREVAARSPDQFFHWNAHGTPVLDWRDEPLQQRLTVTADRAVGERPLNRTYVETALKPGAALPGTAPQEFWFAATGWWPLAGRPAPTIANGSPAALVAAVNSPDYRVVNEIAWLKGRPCQLVERPGRDKLWLDIDRGCSIAARQMEFPESSRTHRVELGGVREVVAGVWAPSEVRNIHSEHNQGRAPRTLKDDTLTVVSVKVNSQVDDARFHFSPLPGSLSQTPPAPPFQAVPGGEDYLDEVAGWIRRTGPKMDGAFIPTPAWDWKYGAAGAGTTCLAFAAFYARRSRTADWGTGT